MMKKKPHNSELFTNLVEALEETTELQAQTVKFNVAEQINQLLRSQEMSKADLARRLGKSRAYVTQILHGDSNFTIESLIKISAALNSEIDIRVVRTRDSIRDWEDSVFRPSTEKQRQADPTHFKSKMSGYGTLAA